MFYARRKNMPKQPFAGFGEILQSGLEAFWGLFLIAIILGGIYLGVFTPTEAAASCSGFMRSLLQSLFIGIWDH